MTLEVSSARRKKMIPFSLYNLYRLRRNQWLRTSELEEIQRRKLRRIIKHAYTNVKYYRKLFNSVGVKPEDIRTVEDLSRIPITTKLQLQELSLNEIVAKGIELEKCATVRTSGSTGIPLDIILSRKEKEFFDMVWARSFMANGLTLKDKRVVIRTIHGFDPPRH